MSFDADSIDRFLGKVLVQNGCWSWLGARSPDGYGKVWMKEHGAFKRWSIHRVMWTLLRWPIPEGLNVLHRCDNPPCSNIDHLFLGTQAENIADMLDKGRQNLGGATRLSDLDVKAIRWLVAQGSLQKDLAEFYGLHPVYVSKLVRGKARANV